MVPHLSKCGLWYSVHSRIARCRIPLFCLWFYLDHGFLNSACLGVRSVLSTVSTYLCIWHLCSPPHTDMSRHLRCLCMLRHFYTDWFGYIAADLQKDSFRTSRNYTNIYNQWWWEIFNYIQFTVFKALAYIGVMVIIWYMFGVVIACEPSRMELFT